MRVILFAILIWFASVTQGQTYFEKTFDIDTLPEIGSSILKHGDNYIITSDAVVDNFRNLNFLLINNQGEVSLSKLYGSDSSNLTAGHYDNLIKYDKSIYVSGEKTNLYTNNGQATFIKMDSLGDTIFMKLYEFDDRNFSKSVVKHNDNFYISGYTSHYDDPGFSNIRGFLIKTDTLGNEIWKKEYLNANIYRKIESLSDGNLVMAGRIKTDVGTNEFDIVVTKVDTAGNEIWTYDPVKLEYQSLEGLVVTSDDEIVAYGYDENSFLLLKLDSDGNLIWEKKYGINTGQNSNSFFNLEVLPDGSFIACGEGTKFSQSSTVLGTVLKICSEGELEWMRYYGAEDFPSHFYDIEPTNDGGYIAVGSTLGNSGTQDIWVLKMDSLGCDTPGCAVNEVPFICPEDTLSINDKLVNNSIKLSIYPNPSQDNIHFQIQNAEKAQFQIFDMKGILIREQQISQNKTLILSKKEIGRGIFYSILKNNHEILERKKFVIN